MPDACCSFCRKDYREVGPLVEGPDEVYICGACADLTRSVIDQEALRRSSGDYAEYLRRKADQVADTVEGEAPTLDPRLSALLSGAGGQVEPGRVESLWELCQATGLLAVVGGILEKVRAKTLQDSERVLLQEIETKAAQLRTALDARAGGQAP